MAVSIRYADLTATNGDVSITGITSGDLVFKFAGRRDGTVITEGQISTTGTSYTEASIVTQTDIDDRISTGLWWIPSAGGSEDTTATTTSVAGSGLVSLNPGGGTTYDTSSPIYREGSKGYAVDGGGSAIWQVTTAATPSLAGDYLLVVVGFVKTDAETPQPLLTVNDPAVVIDDNSATSTGYQTAPYFGVIELTGLTGTQTVTMDYGTSGPGDFVSFNLHTIWLPSNANVTTSAFRWRDDSASESANSGWLAAEDVDITGRATETNTRLRVQLQSSGDVASAAYKLQYRKVGDAGSEWEDIA